MAQTHDVDDLATRLAYAIANGWTLDAMRLIDRVNLALVDVATELVEDGVHEGLTQAAMARALNVPAVRLARCKAGVRAMSTDTDWKARAEREAAAILAEYPFVTGMLSYDNLVSLLALAWMQGVNLGSHETLARVEEGFEEMRATL